MNELPHLIVYGGRNLSLGVMLQEYVPAFARWINLRESIEGTMQRGPYTPAMGHAWLASLDESRGKNEVFAILARGSGEDAEKRPHSYIGHTGIHGIKASEGYGTSGSMILDPEYQGKGCGTEAKLLLLYHCFHVLCLRKVQSTVKAMNPRSMGHLLKCGYRFCGRYRAHVPHNGGFVDELLFEAFPEDWAPLWARYRESGELPKLTDEQRALVKRETGIDD